MAKKRIGKSAKEAACDFLAYKARTIRETERYLDEQNYGEYEIYEAVERLKELNYLNDQKFAADFINSRLATKPVSRRKLKEQLYSHSIAPEEIETAIAGISDETEMKNAMAVAKKYWNQMAALEDAQRKQRTARRLVSRGYDFDHIKACIALLGEDVEDLDFSQMEQDTDE